MGAILRPLLPADLEFSYRVYASTRADEMALVSWNDQQKEDFLRMQFSAQDRFYKENYPGAEFTVILLEGQPVGRLIIQRRAAEIRIMDIALLPAYRNLGLGSGLLRDILGEGRQLKLPVTIHVEQNNPALRLYQRLGFRLKENKGIYWLMEWNVDLAEQAEYVG